MTPIRARYSLPSINWVRWPVGDDEPSVPAPAPMHPLAEILDGAVGAGFGSVGLDTYTVGDIASDPETVDRVGAALRSRRLACSDVGILRLGEDDTLAHAEALARLASSTGAEVCIAVFCAPASRRTLRDARACAEILSAAGARLALEFAPYGHLKTLGEAVDVSEAVGWEWCGLLVDTWHFFRSEAPWGLLESLDGDQIALVHVDDAPPATGSELAMESRFRRVPPGAGCFPLASFANALDRIGYHGVLSAEVLSMQLPPLDGARAIMAALLEHVPSPDTLEVST